jgi:hypothetical protein
VAEAPVAEAPVVEDRGVQGSAQEPARPSVPPGAGASRTTPAGLEPDKASDLPKGIAAVVAAAFAAGSRQQEQPEQPAEPSAIANEPAAAAEPSASPRNAYVIPPDDPPVDRFEDSPADAQPAASPSTPDSPPPAVSLRSILPPAEGMPPGTPNATAVEAQGIDSDLQRVSEEINRLSKSLSELVNKTQALL